MSEEENRVGDGELKVTDKRMFTADGELREEYRHLDADAQAPAEEGRESAPRTADPSEAAPPPPAAPRQPEAPPPEPDPGAGGVGDDGPTLEIPGTPAGLGAPSFADLVTLLAEPIALYLGDVELPDGKSAENLEMARLHIDLLDVLRQKTAGNLELAESRLLEDLLYRCRLRYVQKRG